MKKNGIYVVLVNTIYGGNIGSSARAIKNMGLDGLRLVNPREGFEREAFIMAHGARDVLANAEFFDSLEKAIEDCSLIIGTTARTGGWRRNILTARQIAPLIVSHSKNNKVAILFGKEDTGLSNEEISLCNYCVTIPTSQKGLKSLNLSQAVLLIGYEILLAKQDDPLPPAPSLIDFKKYNFLMKEIKKTLEDLQFFTAGLPEYKILPLHRFFSRAGITELDYRVMLSFINHLKLILKDKIKINIKPN